MRDLLEDWADNPLDLMGATPLAASLGYFATELLSGSVPIEYHYALRETGEWFGYAFFAALASLMVVGTLDNGKPGEARLLMPWLCVIVGVILLWCSDWSLGGVLRARLDEQILTGRNDILWGRLGAVLVALGLILCVGKALIPTTKRHRYH